MSYRYDDGTVVDYSGSLRITRGDAVNVYLAEDFVPKRIKEDLAEATRVNNLEKIREIAAVVTESVGCRACMDHMDSKVCGI